MARLPTTNNNKSHNNAGNEAPRGWEKGVGGVRGLRAAAPCSALLLGRCILAPTQRERAAEISILRMMSSHVGHFP